MVLDIECGQTVDGITDGIAGDEVMSLRFTNDQERDAMFIVTNNTIAVNLTVKDVEGRYVKNVHVKNCDEDECDGVMVTINALPAGLYIVELIVDGNGREFGVNMICSDEAMDGEGTLCPFEPL